MPRLLLVGALSAALCLAFAPAADAKDLCVNNAFVLKGLGSLPRKGTCKSVTGYLGNTPTPNSTSGSACTSSDGGHVTISLMTQMLGTMPQGFADIYEFPLPLPSTTGTNHEARVYPAVFDFGTSGNKTAAVCPPHLPVP